MLKGIHIRSTAWCNQWSHCALGM